MSTLLRAVFAAGFVFALAGPADAVTKTYVLVGKVIAASPVFTSHGGNYGVNYGVTKGARVDVSYTLDLSTPIYGQVGPPDNVTSYAGPAGPVVFFEIKIGTWLAIPELPPVMPRQDFVSVADDSGADANLDLLHLTARAKDNDLVLYGASGPLVFSLDFTAPGGYASGDQGLDQDPTRYPISIGSLIGPGGYVTFSITGAPSPTGNTGAAEKASRSCRKTQISTAGKLCQSQLKCHAAYAKAPQKDYLGLKRIACLEKAGQAFEKAYLKTAEAAAKKGLVCGEASLAPGERSFVTAHVDEIVADVNELPDYAPVRSSWLGASASACAGGLGAEAEHAGKPTGAKLDKARDKVSDKLESAAAKAVAQAQKKNVVFAPPADVDGFVDTVNSVIDELAEAH